MGVNLLVKLWYYSYSLFFCLRYLPFKQATVVPILIWPSSKILNLKRGDIVLTGKIQRKTVLLGFEGAKCRSSRSFEICIENGGALHLGNGINIARGTRIVANGGVIRVGDGFFCNGDCMFAANQDITIADNVLFGWNIELNTTNGHATFCNGVENEMSGPIKIDNHVWVCSDCIIGRGVTIAENVVVARRSFVTSNIQKPNCLYGGTPAKLIKEDYTWKH